MQLENWSQENWSPPLADWSPVVLGPQVVLETAPPVERPVTARVLHLINGQHFSGAERVQQLLGLRLAEFGIDARFVCLKPDRFPRLAGLPPEQVSCLPMRHRGDLRVVGKLISQARQSNIDLLHAHTPRTALVAAMVAWRTGLPWCYHVHSPAARDSTRGLVNRFNGWIERWTMDSCARLITVSRSLRREMLKQGIPRRKIVVVPNGVPISQPIDAAARLEQTHWRLGLVALMRPRKGVELALEALAILKSRGLAVELELIGDFETADYRARILAEIDRLELRDRVHCTGFARDVPATLRRLDALLLPSLFGEGMPMVVLEALAAAVPVVATRVEGTPEVVRDGVEGLLAEPGSAGDLAERIGQLLSDRRQWQRMSQAALARHRQGFTDREMARRIARVYSNLLAVER